MKDQDIIDAIQSIKGIDKIECIAVVWVGTDDQVNKICRGPHQMVVDALKYATENEKSKLN